MKIYDFKEYEKIYAIGDIHGEFRTLFYNIKQGLSYNKKEFNENVWDNKIDDEFKYNRFNNLIQRMENSRTKSKYNKSIIIVAGDCGFGFNKKQYYIDTFKNFDKILESCDTHLLFLRGNHDDPSYFKENILNFNNIICIDDYSIVITKNYTTLCIGGGLSIDRTWRIKEEERMNSHRGKEDKKKLYWENEMPEYNFFELNKIKNEGIIIDSIITHVAPKFAQPKIINYIGDWMEIDKKLKYDINKESDVMDNIFNYFNENYYGNIKLWVHGHYHMFDRKKINGIEFLSLEEAMIYNLNDFNFKSKEKKEKN